MEKIKEYFYKIKRIYKANRNNSILLFSAIFIIGYSLFFTSRSWLDYGDIQKKFTELNSVITLDQRELTLVKWTFCESTGTMEIEVDVNNTSYDGIHEFIFSANNRKGKKYPVETIISSPTLNVIQIKNVKQLSEIRFTMEVNYGDHTSKDMAKFYTNEDMVEKVEEIITYSTMDEYYIARLDRYILDYKNQIAELQNKITEENRKLNSYNDLLIDLNKQKNYVAADELNKITKQIADTTKGIASCNANIEDYNKQIQDIESKIHNTEAIKEVYK